MSNVSRLQRFAFVDFPSAEFQVAHFLELAFGQHFLENR